MASRRSLITITASVPGLIARASSIDQSWTPARIIRTLVLLAVKQRTGVTERNLIAV